MAVKYEQEKNKNAGTSTLQQLATKNRVMDYGISGVQAKPTTTAAKNTTPTYNGLTGLSTGTAQQMAASQQTYQPGQNVTAAQQQLQQIQQQKPQGYNSKYSQQLESIMQQITNPKQFKYSFDGDALYKQMADRYVRQGKQAMMDTMGQAAGLTGGYGNSYAQTAGQQAYDQYLQGLNDKALDLYDRAYQRYLDEQNGLLNQYNVVSGADQTDYGRYRDDVGDYQNELNYWTGRYDTEADRDYGRYTDNRSYWLNLAGMENSDYNTQQQAAEAKRQWDQQFEYNKMSDNRKYAYDICTAILANGKMPSQTQLKAAGISTADAKKMMAQIKTGGGGGRGGSKQGSTYYYANGKFYAYDSSGNMVEVPESQIKDNDTIDTTTIPTITTAGGTGASAVSPAIVQKVMEEEKRRLGQ